MQAEGAASAKAGAGPKLELEHIAYPAHGPAPRMKFQPERFATAITGYGPGWIAVAGERLSHPLILDSRSQPQPWPCEGFDELNASHFAPLAALKPELVILGTGLRLRFPQAAWLRPLIEAGIGVESMDTGAACRTYNILAAEGRHVLAALLLQEPPAA